MPFFFCPIEHSGEIHTHKIQRSGVLQVQTCVPTYQMSLLRLEKKGYASIAICFNGENWYDLDVEVCVTCIMYALSCVC